jgi:polar amino acid transport system permease protein
LGVSVLIEGRNFQRLLLGLWVTARIALVSVFFSVILGVLFGVLMTNKNKIARFLCRAYLEAVRIIPVLVWLFLFYFGLARNFHINMSGEAASILVFTLWGTAEMGDLVRGSITSISPHQYESAFALGLTNIQLYRYVIIPQAVRRLTPGAINLTTRMIKTTSLVTLIGVVEVLKVGQQIIEANFLKSPSASFWVYALIFFFYFMLCMPVSHISKRLERKWQS